MFRWAHVQSVLALGIQAGLDAKSRPSRPCCVRSDVTFSRAQVGRVGRNPRLPRSGVGVSSCNGLRSGICPVSNDATVRCSGFEDLICLNGSCRVGGAARGACSRVCILEAAVALGCVGLTCRVRLARCDGLSYGGWQSCVRRLAGTTSVGCVSGGCLRSVMVGSAARVVPGWVRVSSCVGVVCVPPAATHRDPEQGIFSVGLAPGA